jgi:hypothetical protein
MKEITTMKRVARTLGILALLIGVPALMNAGDRSGTVTGQFLKLGLSARSIGMGGAQVAVADGASSLGYNAAGILGVQDYGFSATYSALYANIQHSYASIVKNIPGFGAVGVSFIMLSTDDIIETTPQAPEGTGRTFRASEYAFSAAYARQVTEQFRVGLNVKYIQSYLFNTELGATSFAVDIGTLYDIPVLKSHLGVSLTNIGKDMTYINELYSLPTALRFGVLVDLYKDPTDQNQFLGVFQITRLNDAEEQYNIGAEYLFDNVIALRGGYKFAYDQEDLTAGFGIRLNSLGLNSMLDYGYNNYKFLPGTHTFTFEFQF